MILSHPMPVMPEADSVEPQNERRPHNIPERQSSRNVNKKLLADMKKKFGRGRSTRSLPGIPRGTAGDKNSFTRETDTESVV